MPVSAQSLRAQCPPKELGRTHTAKASSNTISLFIKVPLIALSALPPRSNQYLSSYCPSGNGSDESMSMSSPTLFSLGFSGLLCFHIKEGETESIFYSAFFQSQPRPVSEADTHHNYIRHQLMEKL